jgi:L-ascorbate metabolism protein UlaG (beta-lactamase superfamily)
MSVDSTGSDSIDTLKKPLLPDKGTAEPQSVPGAWDEPESPSWLKPDEPEDAAEEDDAYSACCDDDDWSFQHPPGQPVHGYVRREFSRILTLDEEDDWREPPIRVERPRWRCGGAGAVPLVTWLGHAGALVQIPWARAGPTEPFCGVVFDPIFSHRCSPSQLVGPARHLDPPCTVAELPAIHACCISHDHYDHLDHQTILDLWACHGRTIHFFVPLGLAAWFSDCGIPNSRITELDWWHEAIISFPATADSGSGSRSDSLDYPATSYPPESGDTARIDPSAALTLKFAFTPAQHRSGRGLFDQMTSLWGSWCVGVVGQGREVSAVKPGMAGWDDFKVYFGGDTGYRYATAPEGDTSSVCPAFAEISERYAPFTLSLLPLSTGSSLPFLRSLLSLSLDQYTLTSSQHCSPADSVDIHLTLRAQRSLGVHWGTFCDASEARATRVEFGRARRDRNVSADWDQRGENGAFVVADIGLVMEIL